MTRSATIAAALLLTSAVAAGAQQTRADSVRIDSVRRAADTSLRATPVARPDSLAARTMLADTARLARRDTGITPQPDQARGVDAEIRAALFELLNDRYVPAYARLQWLAASPVAFADAAGTTSNASAVLRGRTDLMFLLAEASYRLGIDSVFRSNATMLVGQPAGARYAPLLREQLLLDAYRHGDYAGALQQAKSLPQDVTHGLAPLVGGLASYQMRDFQGARAQFAAAEQAGAPYGDYARYMDALTALRMDTAQTASALQSLQTLASSATGPFADQVRLTAAQVAYEAQQYPQAAQLADAVSPTSGFGAEALLTKAWALYKAGQLAPARDAFQQFATQYPMLPDRDESRLMAAQAALQLGQTADAGRIFHAVADSITTESGNVQQGAQAAMTAAAQALVKARAAGLLFLNEPGSGKTIALSDGFGVERPVLEAAFADTTVSAVTPAAAQLVTMSDVRTRFDSLSGALPPLFPRRVLFMPASATANRAAYLQGSSSLFAADVALAIARYRLAEQLASQQHQIALLRGLQQMMGTQGAALDTLAAKLTADKDSLARLAVVLDAAKGHIQEMFQAQLNTTRELATENLASLDSVRRAVAGGTTPVDDTVLALETQTASAYRGLADFIAGRLDSAIAHHPVLAFGDSVRRHGDRVFAMLDSARNAYASARSLIDAEVARLQSGDLPGVSTARSMLASAQAQQQSAEARLMSVVDAELRARSGEMLADLQRDTQAAQFGSASASFFQALDASQQTTGAAATTRSSSADRGVSGTTTTAQRGSVPPARQKK